MSLPLLPLILHQTPPALSRALAQEGVPVLDWEAGPPAGKFVLWDSRRGGRCPLSPQQTAIDLSAAVQDGDDLLAGLADERSQWRVWRIGGVDAVEEVARVDKRALRRLLMARLQVAVEAAGGVWLRLATWPFPYRSAFNFRFDHDEFQPADFKATLKALEGFEGASSHYVCGATHESRTAGLARLRGMDVGSHGYWHHTYSGADENLMNVRRGIDVLRGAGIEPSGFVAPHGRFNRGLLAALESLGVGHSSEFGLAYDDWPFFPAGSRVLQVPIHPICLGIVLEATRRELARQKQAGANHDCLPQAEIAAEPTAAEAVTAHFCRTAEAKHHAGEPIFLYGHPDGRIGRYPQVLRETLAAVTGLHGVWPTTLSAVAEWWRARDAVRWQVTNDDDHLVVTVATGAPGYRLAVECRRGTETTAVEIATVPLDGGRLRFSPDSLTYHRRPEWEPVPSQPFQSHGLLGTSLLRAGLLRAGVKRYLDWEHVTPVEEIRARTWRGWVKRSLRRMRDSRNGDSRNAEQQTKDR